jgi:hypothetical protein
MPENSTLTVKSVKSSKPDPVNTIVLASEIVDESRVGYPELLDCSKLHEVESAS